MKINEVFLNYFILKMELKSNLNYYMFLHQGAHEHYSVGRRLILKMSRQSSKQTCASESGGVMNIYYKIISHNTTLLNYLC